MPRGGSAFAAEKRPARTDCFTVADRVSAEADRGCRPAQQRLKPILAVEKRQVDEVRPVEVQQVEREEHQMRRLLPVPLQSGEGRGAIGTYGAKLAIELSLPALEARERLGDFGVPGCPVEAGAGQQRDVAADDPGVHAVAVEFDFVRRAIAARNRRNQLAQLRLDPGRRRRKLGDPIAR